MTEKAHRLCSVTLLITALCGNVNAQVFMNDNDGLIDVGEVPGFPADPSSATGELRLSVLGIEDLDGTNLLTNVTYLNLIANRITSIEEGDFAGLTKLQTLSLVGNVLTSIEEGDFAGLTNLQTLYLDSNRLASIEEGDFTGLANLQWLNLGHNVLTSIEEGGFTGLTDLRFLDLRHNRLANTEEGDFAGLTNLQLLSLGYNVLTSIEEGDFTGLTNLQTLSLLYNRLDSIEEGDFAGLTNLRNLYLEGNRLASIEDGGFAGLRNLETLDLISNNLTALNLTGAAFENLQPLDGLDAPSGYIHFSGLGIDDNITSLVLDDAKLSRSSFDALVDAVAVQTSIVDVSLVDLIFTDPYPKDLSALLSIPSLDNVRIDPSLFNRYTAELNAFAAIPGNTVSVASEPSSAFVLVLTSIVWSYRNRRRWHAIM